MPAAQRAMVHAGLCDTCAAHLPWYDSARCPQCALPSPLGEVCGQCLRHPFAFDQTYTQLRYAYPLDRLLQQFKYHQHLAWGALLASSMTTLKTALEYRTPADSHSSPLPCALLAMPMHSHRLQQRGFNHALVLAQTLANAWHTPLLTRACRRVLDTPSQAGLDMKTRTRNLRRAFVVDQPLTGLHVLLVDDVMTTGASMHALAHSCKQAGAVRVTALVLARTLKEPESSR